MTIDKAERLIIGEVGLLDQAHSLQKMTEHCGRQRRIGKFQDSCEMLYRYSGTTPLCHICQGTRYCLLTGRNSRMVGVNTLTDSQPFNAPPNLTRSALASYRALFLHLANL